MSDISTQYKSGELILHKVGRHHFAFLKAYLEGLDLRQLAARYLETVDDDATDMRVIKSTLGWIRGELRLVAMRNGKAAHGRAIMIDPELLVVQPNRLPSLDAFREEYDPDEALSEKELIEAFQEQYGQTGSSRKTERNIRLRRKQADALFWLQEMAITDPNPLDSVAAWLKPIYARKLMAVQINTLNDLILQISRHGYRWFRNIPGLGEKSASRINRWLSINRQALQCSIDSLKLKKESQYDIAELRANRPQELGVVPLEYFDLPRELDGSHGSNRGLNNKSGAHNDYSAIHLWLSNFPPESNTYISYRSQAERFLLWAVLERGKALSSLDTADCIAYRDFLWDLGRRSPESWAQIYRLPEQVWLGKRKCQRWSPDWRPFEALKTPKPPKTVAKSARAQWIAEHTVRDGVLKPSSQKLAQTILSSMCEWLSRRRYLDYNPWDGVRARASQSSPIAAHHSFSRAQWTFLLDYLENRPRDGHYLRLKCLLITAYLTGLRLSELVAMLRGDFQFRQDQQGGHQGWLVTVVGKGQKPRLVPVPSPAMAVIDSYLQSRGYASWQQVPPEVPLLGHLTETRPHLQKLNQIDQKIRQHHVLGKARVYRSLKKFFAEAADQYQLISEEGAAHIRAASTHWLRHTAGTHAVENGVPMQVVQSNFGHSSINTTAIYTKPEILQRICAMENFAQAMSHDRHAQHPDAAPRTAEESSTVTGPAQDENR